MPLAETAKAWGIGRLPNASTTNWRPQEASLARDSFNAIIMGEKLDATEAMAKSASMSRQAMMGPEWSPPGLVSRKMAELLVKKKKAEGTITAEELMLLQEHRLRQQQQSRQPSGRYSAPLPEVVPPGGLEPPEDAEQAARRVRVQESLPPRQEPLGSSGLTATPAAAEGAAMSRPWTTPATPTMSRPAMEVDNATAPPSTVEGGAGAAQPPLSARSPARPPSSAPTAMPPLSARGSRPGTTTNWRPNESSLCRESYNAIIKRGNFDVSAELMKTSAMSKCALMGPGWTPPALKARAQNLEQFQGPSGPPPRRKVQDRYTGAYGRAVTETSITP